MRVRVIGIGTPHGDDAAGLAVVDALRARGLPDGVDAVACARPGLDLPHAFGDAAAAVLVDAMRSGGPPGRVERVALDALPRPRGLSSHGLGVAEGLALAEALGRRPGHVVLVGIEGETDRGETLSPAVRGGVARAVSWVAQLAEALRDAPVPGTAPHPSWTRPPAAGTGGLGEVGDA